MIRNNPSVLGLDVGGTKIAAARFDADSLEKEEALSGPTNAEFTFRYVRQQILQSIGILKKPGTKAVGIGVPGFVDQKTQRILRLPNIPGAKGFDLKSFIKERTGLKVVIANDAQCFALAEAKLGAGRGRRVVIGITLGTGVGGGIVVDGKLFSGSQGFAGEFGHMLLMPGMPPFQSKNRRGEVEQFLSGTALGKRCPAAKNSREYLSGDACSFLHPRIFREVAWMVASLAHAVDPGIIVFGGSAGHALKPHLGVIRSQLKKWMLPGIPRPLLKTGELENSAVLGAALLARDIF